MKLNMVPALRTLLLAVLALSSAANAAFIKGQIDFGILATLDNKNLGSATKVKTWNTTFVTQASNDFDTFANPFDPATFTNGWTFTSGPLSPLWTSAGFTFDLTSSSIVSQSNTFLNVVGSGLVSGNGFDPTVGTWSFTVTSQGTGPKFSFVASTSAVPDGGTSVALLGVSLLGLAGVRRKLRK